MTYSLLDSINKKFGPHDFGRICQVMLGITFKAMGYQMSLFQLSGRPDMIAVKDGKGFCIEVKAPSCEKVTLKKEDIEGVCNQGYQPIICVNTFPSVEPKWLFINAEKLKSGTFRTTSLESQTFSEIQEEINKTFMTVLEKYYENCLTGVDCIRRIFDSL